MNGTLIKLEPKETLVAESAVDKYKKALEAAQAIKNFAVEELKKEITSKIAELNAFGFSFKLTEGGSSVPGRKRAPSTKEKHCPVCNIAGHDKRNHRNQDPLKRFTVKELDERGLPHA
jgi:hypothetical protein